MNPRQQHQMMLILQTNWRHMPLKDISINQLLFFQQEVFEEMERVRNYSDQVEEESRWKTQREKQLEREYDRIADELYFQRGIQF